MRARVMLTVPVLLAAVTALGAVAPRVLAPAAPLAPAAVVASSTGDRVVALTYGGLRREYRLHLPPNADSGRRLPLVVVLHGLHNSPAATERLTGFSALADAEGFVVAYPAGWRASWNAGACCGDAAASGVDDVGFLLAVRSAVLRSVAVDGSRVFVTGFSNGGMMSYRLACEAAGAFRAIAVVGGTLEAPCPGTSPVPVLHVHGLADSVVPFGGLAHSRMLNTRLTPVEDAVALWRERNAGRAPAELVSLPTLTHHWPTAADGYDATRAIWGFFRR